MRDELLANIKAALDSATKLRQTENLTEEQAVARGCVVADLLNALAHAHNLVISIEKGISPFFSVPWPKKPELPKQTALTFRPGEKEVTVQKLKAKLDRLKRELGGSDEARSQAELFPSEKGKETSWEDQLEKVLNGD